MNIINMVNSWINLYFFDPLRYPANYPPYNIYNTAMFAIIGLVCALIIYKYFKSNKILFDNNLYRAIIPFVLLGLVIRVLVDAKTLPRMVLIGGFTVFPFVTPLIYILIFLILIFFLLLIRKIFGNERYTTKLFYSGLILDFLFVSPLLFMIKNPISTVLIIGLTLIGSLIGYFVLKFIGINPTKLETFTLISQSLDGAATFIGVSIFGYSEQHVLGNAIFNFFGTPFAFFVLKLLFVIVAIKIVNNELNDEKYCELRVFVLLMITIFGIGPGTRDTLRLLSRV